jgi:hypothetical protein
MQDPWSINTGALETPEFFPAVAPGGKGICLKVSLAGDPELSIDIPKTTT